MRAWRIHRYASPSSALELDDIERPEPGEGQVLIRVCAVTINANDIDGCYGRYKIVKPELPFTPGMELMGEVEAAGEGCEGWVGKRVVACPSGATGGFAEYAVADQTMIFEAGINAYTQSLALSQAKHGIRANVIMPGLMETPMAIEGISKDRGIPKKELIEMRHSQVPLRQRMGTAWDIAWAAVYLASDEANFVTGVALPIDGGQSARIG